MSNIVELDTRGPSWELLQLNGRGASVSFTSQHLLGGISKPTLVFGLSSVHIITIFEGSVFVTKI